MNIYRIDNKDSNTQNSLYNYVFITDGRRLEIIKKYGINFCIYKDTFTCPYEQFINKIFIENNFEIVIDLWNDSGFSRRHFKSEFIKFASRYSKSHFLEMIIKLEFNGKNYHFYDNYLSFAAEREDDNVEIIDILLKSYPLTTPGIIDIIQTAAHCGNNKMCKHMINYLMTRNIDIHLLDKFKSELFWETDNVELLDYLIKNHIMENAHIYSGLSVLTKLNTKNIKLQFINCIQEYIDSGLLASGKEILDELERIKNTIINEKKIDL
jgi:hypothetical protein